MTSSVNISVAFVAGMVSFLAPCILPIIPGFLSYLAGTSLTESTKKRKEIFLNSVFFVLGFSSVFALLGVLLNTLLEAVAYDVQIWLSRIGGVLIIFFGFFLTGLLRIPFLEREHKITLKPLRSRYMTSFVFGAAFAAGWTPCVGAALGAILALAATDPSKAFVLLLAYALGLGFPFLLVGLFAAQAHAFISKYLFAVRFINIVFGIVLIILGMLVFSQQLSRIASFELLNRFLPAVEEPVP